jgi:VanZ like family
MRLPKLSRVWRWGLVAAWAAVIFAFSSTPGSALPGGYSVQAHLIEYAIFGAVLYAALRLDHPPARAAVLAIALASAYGITDEWHQSFVPMRTPDPVDWLLDTTGATIAVLAAVALERFARHRSAQTPQA